METDRSSKDGSEGLTDDAHLLKLMSCSSWSEVLAVVTPSRATPVEQEMGTAVSFEPCPSVKGLVAEENLSPMKKSSGPLNGKSSRAALGSLGFGSPRVNAHYNGRSFAVR